MILHEKATWDKVGIGISFNKKWTFILYYFTT